MLWVYGNKFGISAVQFVDGDYNVLPRYALTNGQTPRVKPGSPKPCSMCRTQLHWFTVLRSASYACSGNVYHLLSSR